MIGKNQEKGNKKSMVVTLIKKPEQDFRLRFLKKIFITKHVDRPNKNVSGGKLVKCKNVKKCFTFYMVKLG